MLSRKFIAAVVVVLFSATFNQAPAQFQPGQFISYGQDDWGLVGTPSSELLAAHIDSLYPNGVEIGTPGPAGNSALFTTLDPILDYLPTSGSPGPLDTDLLDPTSTSAGVFVGYVLAMKFNVDFDDAGWLAGTATTPLGNLVLHNIDSATFPPGMNGLSLRQFLAYANLQLGDVTLPEWDKVSLLADAVSTAFESGQPSQFAQDHLRIPGDFNRDFVVDAADYVVWRKNDGAPERYNEWRTYFGLTTASDGGSSSVLEPTGLCLFAFGFAIHFCRSGRPRAAR